MGRPADNDSRPSEQGNGIETGSVARQDTMSEKRDFEKDVETGRQVHSAHIDAAVVARIADNVEDFMVTTSCSFRG